MSKDVRPQRWLIGWVCLIFVTSCFLVSFQASVNLIEGLSHSAAFNHWFEAFWRRNWFFVVKRWHMTEYAILLSLAVAAFRCWKIGGRFGSIGIAFVFAALFAASDEWHQTFVPGRDGCLSDVLIDMAGALLAAVSWLVQRGGQNRLDKRVSVRL